MLATNDITELLAGFYAKYARLQPARMLLLAEVLENLRRQLSKDNPYKVWDLLDLDDEKYRGEVCLPMLLELRQASFELYFTRQFEAVNVLAGSDKAAAGRLLRQYFAAALINFREDFVCLLQQQSFHFSEEIIAWQKDLARLRLYLAEDRWPDIYPLYQEIAQDAALPLEDRALAELICGEIVLYHFPDPMQAERHFANLESILPGHYYASIGWGELALKKGEYQAAREKLLEAVSKEPRYAATYSLIGDCFLDERKQQETKQKEKQASDDGSREAQADGEVIKTAAEPEGPKLAPEEFWYYESWRVNCLQVDSIRRLLSLYAFTKEIAGKENKIQELFGEALRVKKYPAAPSCFTAAKYGACFTDTTPYKLRKELAFNHHSFDRLEEGDRLLDQAIQEFPALPSAYVDKAYQKIKTKEMEAAGSLIDKALEIDPENFEACWAMAYLNELKKDKDMALSAYRKCLQIRPAWDDWINNFIGNVYYDFEDFEKAGEHYWAAHQKNEQYTVYRNNYYLALQKQAETKENNGQKEEAFELFLQLAEKRNEAKDWNKLGNIYYGRSQFPQAESCYARAISIKPGEAVYHENRGLALEKQGILEEARSAFMEAVSLNKTDGSSLGALGLFYYDHAQYAAAADTLALAVAQEPENRSYLITLGLSYERIGKEEEALAVYNKVAALEPQNDGVQNRIGLVFYRRQDFETALGYFEQAAALNDKQVVYRQNIALSKIGLGKSGEAIGILEKLLEEDAGIPEVYDELAIAYGEEGKQEAIIDLWQKALQQWPGNIELLNKLGTAYYRHANYAKAIEYYQAASAGDPNNALFMKNLSLAYRDSGDLYEALTAQEKVCALEAANYLNWNDLGNYYCMMSEETKAISAYDKAIAIQPADKTLFVNKALAYVQLSDFRKAEAIMNNESMDKEARDVFRQQVEVLYPEVQLEEKEAGAVSILGSSK